jgi:hypothetical protein
MYDLRQRMNLSHDERLILELSIMMLKYLDESQVGASVEDELPEEEIQRAAERSRLARERRNSKISWDCDDFFRLICSGGFELRNGQLVPRF